MPTPRFLISMTSTCLVLASFVAPSAAAEGFRIDNRVFVGNDKTPSSTSATIFADHVVYGFLDDPAEVIVFEKAVGRFVLLDTQREIRSELTTDEVAAFTTRLREWAIGHRDPLVSFFAEPKFQESYNAPSAMLVLSSPLVTYEVQAARTDPVRTEQCREFSDWYARLNTVLNPGSRPPMARLALDEALARRQLIARAVKLTTVQNRGEETKRTIVRSEHQLSEKLVAADLQRVAKAQQQMQSLKLVSFEQYRKR